MQTYQSTTNGPSTTSSSSSTTEQAKDKAKEQAQQVAGQARGTLRSQVDQRSTQAGERVGGFASDVRSIGDQLREQGKDQPAKLAEQAADRAERVGSYLRDSDADRILGDVEDFGRRQPWVVMAGGVAIGLVASRFLKASSSRRYESRYQSRYETSGRLPARTGDVAPGTGLGAGDVGTTRTGATSGVGATGAGVAGAGTSDIGTTGAGVRGSDLGTTRVGTGDAASGLGSSPSEPPPVTREPGIGEPSPGRAAEDVSLSGGVLPDETPGSTAPERGREGSR